jgi:hypothetical protein
MLIADQEGIIAHRPVLRTFAEGAAIPADLESPAIIAREEPVQGGKFAQAWRFSGGGATCR